MRERDRDREREREAVASIVTAACGEERSAKGHCPCASTVVTFSPIVYSAACGLPWFFPSLWAFHINTCAFFLLLSLFLFCVHKPTVRLWPSKVTNRILTNDSCITKQLLICIEENHHLLLLLTIIVANYVPTIIVAFKYVNSLCVKEYPILHDL